MEKSKLEKQFIELISSVKGFNDEEMLVSGVIGSDGSVDRHGDSINPKGWVLDNFQKNPVILLNHDYGGLPIGKATNVKRKDGALTFDIKFSKTYELAKTAYSLLKEGILNAWSVGFIPLEWGKAGGEFTINKMELLELSLVTVPANPNALTPRQLKSIEALNKSVTVAPDAEKKAVSEPVVAPLEEKTPESGVEDGGVPVEDSEKDKNDTKRVLEVPVETPAESSGEAGSEPVVDTKEVVHPTLNAEDGHILSEAEAQEKSLAKLLELPKLKEMIEAVVRSEVEKALDCITKAKINSVESDEEEVSDPQVLLLTSIAEELRTSNKGTGKTLQAFNKLLTSQLKD